MTLDKEQTEVLRDFICWYHEEPAKEERCQIAENIVAIVEYLMSVASLREATGEPGGVSAD